MDKKKIFTLIGALVLVALIAIGVAVYSYRQYNQLAIDSGVAAGKEIKSYIANISRFMVLPDEAPTLATVTDMQKLQGQLFFKLAQKNDKVLIYAKAKKAILYRPAENKVIEVGVLTIDNTQATPKTSVNSDTLKLVILNGSKTPGLATALKALLADEAIKTETILVGNTQVATYTASVIINLSKGKKTATIQALGKSMGLKYETQIPSVEQAALTKLLGNKTADAVIIVGK